ncbi:uncharacterized protein L201_000043 [Kwoniella dendrophila CBS 6074]|uniref:U3 small nucleolar RNA-associated protein 18 n=1 Tax=Kwoniella dendrophila CBS 6074 TaxID=1295534 RepID=A0AAX4JKL1_9TREE
MAQKNKRRSRPSDFESVPRTEEVTHDWEKSDEELELEEALFGTSKIQSKSRSKGKGPSSAFVVDNEGDENDDDQGGLSDLDDNDLFTIDAPLAGNYQNDLDELPDDDVSSDDQDKEEISDAESSSSSSSSGSSSSGRSGNEFRAISPSSSSSGSTSPSISKKQKKGIKPTNDEFNIELPDDIIDLEIESEKLKLKSQSSKCIWNDPSDDLIGSMDLNDNRRLKKLERGKKRKLNKQDNLINGKELQEKLREQFERLHPPPEWAKKRTVIGTPSLSSLLTSTKSFIQSPSNIIGEKRLALPQGNIDLQRMRNANQQNPTTGKREASNAGGGIVDFAWHPSEKVGVMAVAGGDRRVRFFNIDGHTNPTLMTLHIPSLPLTKSTFHPSGSSLLLVGNRPYYYTYDLTSQRCLRSPKNLFGSMETGSSPNSLSRHSFSPDGSLLAVAGRRGAISILDWSSNGGVGSGGIVAEFRSGRGGQISDLNWDQNGKELNVLGGRDGTEIEVWDLSQRKIIRKWKDDRSLGGTLLKSSKDGQYTAIGSTTGIVNLYDSNTLNTSTPTDKYTELKPEPIKSFEQLTMSINTIAFHPSNEIMVTSSGVRKDLLKIYHLQSKTAFSNWPTPATPLGRITSTGFSPSGEYLSVGNQRGTVLLWSLRHYAL